MIAVLNIQLHSHLQVSHDYVARVTHIIAQSASEGFHEKWDILSLDQLLVCSR